MITVALLVQQHVARLDVAVHQAALMGGVERLGELVSDVHHPLGSERRGVSQQRLQVNPIDVAHRDKQAPVGLARVVHRDHVWVVQARRQPRLPQQPLAEALVQREALRQHLQRHRAPEPGIACEIDLAHAAAPDPRPHVVDPDRGALEWMSVSHRCFRPWLVNRFLGRHVCG